MTDNEKIATLQESVSNLKETVKTGFIDVKLELKEIKDGLVSRVERLEVTKLSASDFITFKKDYAEDMDKIKKFIYGASAIIGLIQFVGAGILVFILKAVLK